MGIREQYPLLYAFGDKQEFLTSEAAEVATVNQRIESIWPFIAGKVLAFQQTLTRRERANLDHEDTVSDLIVSLLEKDSLWEPERGDYITFAGAVIKHELCAIRDAARTVHSPRNSSSRIKEYATEETAGEISQRRQKTANDIRRTQNGIQAMVTWADPKCEDSRRIVTDERPESPLVRTETAAEIREAAVAAVKTLDSTEAMVIGALFGLWGKPQISLPFLAWKIGIDPLDLAKIKSSAMAKIRHVLNKSRRAE